MSDAWPGDVALDLTALALDITVAACPRGEQVILSDGLRRIGLIVAGGSLLAGPVPVRFVLDYDAGLARRVVTLRRLTALLDTGRFPKSLFPREPRAGRWLMALRAFDADADGASQREIAEVLFGPLFRATRWKADGEFLRLRVNRLLRLGRRMTATGYRALLD